MSDRKLLTPTARRASLALAVPFVFAAGVLPAAAQTITVPDYVQAAVDAPARTPDDKVRDADRKPAQMVAFSGIKPGDVVADLVPGGGYYTRILSKVVGAFGRVYDVVPMNGYPSVELKARQDAIARGEKPRPLPVEAVLALENTAEYKNVTVLWQNLTAFGGSFAIPEQLDAVWTTNNYHDLHNPGTGAGGKAPDMTIVNKFVFLSLKPGATYFVADHAAAKGAGFSVTSTLHRSDEDAVKAEIMGAGFVLDGESDVLRNTGDDHSKPVFQMHDKTDQFVLRFKKPASVNATDLRPPVTAMRGSYGNTQDYGFDDPNQRWVYYHPDGTYQEWGNTGTLAQEGLWYWDAAGRSCMLHQFPSDERGGVVCHPLALNRKVGDIWVGDNNRTIRVLPGHVLPPRATLHPCDPIACQPPPTD